jgi:hypothetical protein
MLSTANASLAHLLSAGVVTAARNTFRSATESVNRSLLMSHGCVGRNERTEGTSVEP